MPDWPNDHDSDHLDISSIHPIMAYMSVVTSLYLYYIASDTVDTLSEITGSTNGNRL